MWRNHPVAVSHTRIVFDKLDETINLPSGLKLIDEIDFVCPAREPINFAVFNSHSFMILLPEARNLPSGL